MSSTTDRARRGPALLDDFSLEITGKDVEDLRAAAAELPAGTRVNLTFLGNEDTSLRVQAVGAIVALGLRPVPHLSARRFSSRAELDSYLGALARLGASEEVVVIGGDPSEPEGPFPDSLSVIASGALAEHGVRHVHVAGYPEGHPKITDEALWQALADKAAALREQGLGMSVATQFGFDAAAVVSWIEELRAQRVTAPVRIGVPGPAGVQRLLRYARRFGVGSSASVVQKYGFSLTGLLGTAGPSRFVTDLGAVIDPEVHGRVSMHFYTFGGVRATAGWVRTARAV